MKDSVKESIFIVMVSAILAVFFVCVSVGIASWYKDREARRCAEYGYNCPTERVDDSERE